MPLDIPKKALALAQSVGIDLKPIVNWAVSVEQRLNLMAEEMPQKTAEALMKMAEEQRQKQLAQMQQAAASGQGVPQGQGLGQLIAQGIPLLFGGGGGSNAMMDAFTQSAISKAMIGMDLANALLRGIVVRLAPEIAAEVTKDIVKKE